MGEDPFCYVLVATLENTYFLNENLHINDSPTVFSTGIRINTEEHSKPDTIVKIITNIPSKMMLSSPGLQTLGRGNDFVL